MRHRRLTMGVLPFVALILIGCSSADPRAVPSPIPTPAPTAATVAEPVATTLVIGALGVEVLDEGGSPLRELSFLQPASAAVAFLTTLFEAEPTISHRESDYNCVAAANLAIWEGYFTLTSDVEGWTPAGQATFAYAVAPESANGIQLRTASGFGVGDSVDDLIASQPGVGTDLKDFEGVAYAWVHYDVGEGVFLPESDPNWGMGPCWGASATAVDGVITGLHSPVPYIDLC